MAIPVIQSFTSADSGGVTSIPVDFVKPSNVAVGDLLVILTGNDAGVGPLVPTGWTEFSTLDGGTSLASFSCIYRIADGTEPATQAVETAGGQLWGSYLHITGHDPDNIIDIVGTETQTAAAATHTIASVTSVATHSLGFYILAFDGGDGAPFSVAGDGWVEQADLTSGTGANDACGTWGTKELAKAGASVNAVVTPTVTDTASVVQFIIGGLANDNQRQVKADISQDAAFTDWLQLRGDRNSNQRYRGHFHVLGSMGGTFSATVTVQYKFPTEADSEAKSLATTYTAADAFIIEWAGDVDVRIGIIASDYTSGIAELVLNSTQYRVDTV